MTPKEKAKELIDKMHNSEHCGIKHFPNKKYCECVEMNLFQAKQCAIIAVDEILKTRPGFPYPYDVGLEIKGIFNIINYPTVYWQEVKQHIQKL